MNKIYVYLLCLMLTSCGGRPTAKPPRVETSIIQICATTSDGQKVCKPLVLNIVDQ